MLHTPYQNIANSSFGSKVGYVGSQIDYFAGASITTVSTWVNLTPTPTTADSYGITICIHGSSKNGATRTSTLAIGLDVSGGTSYTTLVELYSGNAGHINNVSGGFQGSNVGYQGGCWYYFPVFIPSGTMIGATLTASAGSVSGLTPKVNIWLDQQPSYVSKVATTCTSFTATFTPGGNGVKSAWQNLGTLTDSYWWWQVNHQDPTLVSIAGTSITVDIAVGDATNKDIIIADYPIWQDTAYDQNIAKLLVYNCERYAPVGANLYIRSLELAVLGTSRNFRVIGCR